MIRKILKTIASVMAVLILALIIYGLVQYPKAKGEQHFTAERIVNAPKDKVWDIISDVGNYHEVTAPNISKVEILKGSGLGMVRECSAPSGHSWEEVCTIWEPGEVFGFQVNTDREDYPFPLKSLSGLWKVEEVDANHTRILLDFSYEFQNAFLSGYFLSAGIKQAKEDTEFLLDNWQHMAEDKTMLVKSNSVK